MKTIFLFLAIGIVSSMMLLKDVTPGDPIPGCDVKVGRKPPGGNALATTVTDTSGYFEFNNLEAGNGYYVEFDLAALGLDTSSIPAVIEGIGILVSSPRATEAKQKDTYGKQKAEDAKQKGKGGGSNTIIQDDRKDGGATTASITRIFGNVEATVTVDSNSIRGTLRYKNE
ncbi:MAG: hypothetical protein L6Q97_11050 [Thermoanaerobaculia bacterium]|nr:hypothetical protein [Thermoanaerobaculia bacterium]